MKKMFALTVLSLVSSLSFAAEFTTTLDITNNEKTSFGTVSFSDSPYGLLIIPNLSHLPPGNHGFHLHQNPDCSNAGMSAGGHFDPAKTNTHQGPYGKGHLGDLPVLFVDETGTATTPLLAPRLKTTDINGLTLMVHAGGDNYSDNPPLGGGGARLACGVITKKN